MDRQCAVLLVVALLHTHAAVLAAANPPAHAELGRPETVLADGALGLRYFPDGRLAVVSTAPAGRVLVAAGVATFLLEGPAVGRFTKATKVLDKGRPGEFDNGYAGINSVWRAPTGELLAFYHAEDQAQMGAVGHGIPGFYGRVALAVSRDDGATFEKRGPLLSGQLPKDPHGSPDQGVGEPWVLAEPSGEYLYAWYTSHERMAGRGPAICLARCRATEALTPGAWRKYYAGGFTEPGLGGQDTPVVTSGAPRADALFPQVVYARGLRQFVMTFCVNAWREDGQAQLSGFYVAFSDDGVAWPRERMQQIWRVPVVARPGCEVAWHPTFVADASDGASGWLYYGYSENWGHQPPRQPHYLVRRRLTLSAGGPGGGG